MVQKLSVSEQTLFDDANDLVSFLVDKEMIAFEHAYATAASRQFTPAFEFRLCRSVIFRAADRRDGTLQLRTGNKVVSATNREVGAQHRYQKFHQLRVVEHFLRRSVQPLHLGDKFGVGQRVNLGIALGQLRRAPSGNKEMVSFQTPLGTQAPSKFEADERAHAVAQKRERPIEIRKDLARERFDERLELRERRFAQAELTPGQYRGNNFNIAVNHSGPRAKNRAAATGIRKTEQPESSPGIRLHLKPGRIRECPGAGSRSR